MLSILYWSQIYSPPEETLHPIFFFHPDMEFLEYIRDKGFYHVPICIRGTNGLYDGIHRVTVDSPTRLGSCPPDYNSEKPVLVAFLKTPFTTYPYTPSSFSLLSS